MAGPTKGERPGSPRRRVRPSPELLAEVRAQEAGWPLPRRFDPDDRSTWPADEQRVLVFAADMGGLGGEWVILSPVLDGLLLAWVRDDGNCFDPKTGDLWLPLPPRPGGEEP